MPSACKTLILSLAFLPNGVWLQACSGLGEAFPMHAVLAEYNQDYAATMMAEAYARCAHTHAVCHLHGEFANISTVLYRTCHKVGRLTCLIFGPTPFNIIKQTVVGPP